MKKEETQEEKIARLLEVDRLIQKISGEIIELAFLSGTAALGLLKHTETIIRACIIRGIPWTEDNPEKK